MNRRIFKLCLFLLLGAIINVALAWGCVMFIHVRMNMDGRDSFADHEMTWNSAPFRLRFPPREHPAVSSWSGTATGKKSQFLHFELVNDSIMYGRLDVGWPCLGLCAETWQVLVAFDRERSDLEDIVVNRRAITAPTQPKDDFYYLLPNCNFLPVRPVWPGFAINTIFYAAVLWLPFAAFGRIRRRRRIKRGLCVRCGYDLRGRGNSGGSACPECGNSLKPS